MCDDLSGNRVVESIREALKHDEHVASSTLSMARVMLNAHLRGDDESVGAMMTEFDIQYAGDGMFISNGAVFAIEIPLNAR